MDKDDRIVFAAGAVLFIGAVIGGLINLYEAGIERGRRMQFKLDKERAEKKGFTL